MVRHIKTAFENKKKKKKKHLTTPLQLIKKVMTHPIFYPGFYPPPPPVELMNGPLRHSDWRVIHVDHHVARHILCTELIY